MFQMLNKMFSGDFTNVSSQETKFSEKEDDEWILVDFIVDACTRLSEETAAFEEITHVEAMPILPHISSAYERLGTTSDSYFTHFNSCPMEESWFVTPPPCFTAGDLTTVKVETSPMENLLIEHPSMSVYAFHNYLKEEIVCELGILSANIVELDKENETKGKRIHCYVAARLKGLESTKTYRTDVLSKRQLEKHLNRKSFRRQNHIRSCRSKQMKQCGLLVHQPSQRRYNY